MDDTSPSRQTARAIEDTARLITHLRKSAPSTQHQIDLARALVESTRELLRQLKAKKP